MGEPRPRRTALRLAGRDALALLHRLSTNALLDLPAGAARATLFCDFRGRLLHRAAVARSGDGAVWLVRDDAPGASLLSHIDRHVFREDVTIEDRSAAWIVLAEWTGGDGDAVEERQHVPIVIPEGRGFTLRLAPAGSTEPADPARMESERITRGRPRHGHEIHEDFNPFEIGCGDEVHLSKGCYTGQEALQRLVTYGSVRRSPVLVRGHGAPPAVPRNLVTAGGQAGRLTSAARAEADGEWVGIAIVRREALAGGDAGAAPPFELEGGPAVDAVMPFPDRRPLGRRV